MTPEELLAEARYFRYCIGGSHGNRYNAYMEALIPILEREAAVSPRPCPDHPYGACEISCASKGRKVPDQDLTPRQQTLAVCELLTEYQKNPIKMPRDYEMIRVLEGMILAEVERRG